MIGDLILWIRKTYKQQTCIHKYKVDTRSVMLDCDCMFCKKCLKYKKI